MRCLLLLVLLAGCARYTQPDRVIELPIAERRALAREVMGLTKEPRLPTVQESAHDGIMAVWCARCCPDDRWGKCEEHGEWLTPWGGTIVFLRGHGSWASVTCYSESTLKLLCPRGHYIERSIEGRKEKP